MSEIWIEVCAKSAIGEEDAIRFHHGDKTYAIFRSPEDTFHATDSLCTQKKIHLAHGLVMDEIIERPKHNSRFLYKMGEAMGAPVCVNLQTYRVKVEAETIFLKIS